MPISSKVAQCRALMGGPDSYWRSRCGRFSVHCADALGVMPLLADGTINFVITDPPYGHNNNDGDLFSNREAALGSVSRPTRIPQTDLASNWEKATGRKVSDASLANPSRPILNDGPEANDIYRGALTEWNRLLVPGGCCACCCSGGAGQDPHFPRWSLWMDEVIGLKQIVVWDKGPMGMGWHYRRSYETILIGMKKGAPCKWYDETNKVENIIRPKDGSGIRKIIPGADHHPTPKPVELAEHFIKLHTKENDLVLDPFMGHGWVAQACYRLRRRFIGIELDRGHCDRAIGLLNVEMGVPATPLPPERV